MTCPLSGVCLVRAVRQGGGLLTTWDLEAEDGRRWWVRFRRGVLEVYAADDLEAPLWEVEPCGSREWSGEMETDEMLELTGANL